MPAGAQPESNVGSKADPDKNAQVAQFRAHDQAVALHRDCVYIAELSSAVLTCIWTGLSSVLPFWPGA